MERKIYLEMCREAAEAAGRYGNRNGVPPRLRVVFDGQEYVPLSYELAFEYDGTVRHTAILHEVGAKAVVYAPLGKVARRE